MEVIGEVVGSPDQRLLARRVAEGLANGDRAYFDQLDAPSKQWITAIFADLQRDGVSIRFDLLWELDFDVKPMTVTEFLFNDEYLGFIGPQIYDCWLGELEYVHNPANKIFEWIITGAIGTGKTTVAVISLLYRIYYLLCMKDPQKYYDLIRGSKIVFGLFNIYKYLVHDTSFTTLVEYTKMSPYFNQYRDPKKTRDSYAVFPKNVGMALGTDSIHVLGQNMFGGLLDEANFGRATAKSKQPSATETTQVGKLYNATRERVDSRFMDEHGDVPGLLMLVSSANNEKSFLETHKKGRMSDPYTHISGFSRWEAKTQFSGYDMFEVFVGDAVHTPHIIDPVAKETVVYPPDRVIEVPEVFKQSFERDIYVALRDIAGVPTFGYGKFILRRDLVMACVDMSRVPPFETDAVYLGLEYPHDLVTMLRPEELLVMYDEAGQTMKPKYFPNAVRFIHVDHSLTTDSTGFCMGCISGVQTVERQDSDGRVYRDQDYNIWVDIALEIKPAPNDEIDYGKIRSFIKYLSSSGFMIAHVGFDGYQSADSIQILKKSKMEASVISVDRTREPYTAVKQTLYEGRLNMYHHQPLLDNLFDVEDTGKKIDHTPEGAKDVSDALAGMVWKALTSKGSESQPLSPAELANMVVGMEEANRASGGGIEFSWDTGESEAREIYDLFEDDDD